MYFLFWATESINYTVILVRCGQLLKILHFRSWSFELMLLLIKGFIERKLKREVLGQVRDCEIVGNLGEEEGGRSEAG